ncbi:MAG TPA: phage minor head protein [archaeon]|nr:phage minor head protein [archaeon]
MEQNHESKSVFDGFFWFEEADILFDILFSLIKGLAVKIGKQAASGIDISWELVNDAVVEWARQFSAEEVTKITTVTRKMVQTKVSDWIASGQPLRELEKQLLPEFGAVRAKRIAVTEVTNAYAGGNLETWRASEMVEEKQWFTAGTDVCEICLGLDGQIVPLNAMFISDFDGSTHERPPAHVNCKCWMQPIVKKP